MFIKLGDYRFNENDIICIRKFPSGCRVYLRSGTTMDVDEDEEDWEIIEGQTISKKNELKPVYLKEVEK